MKKIIFNQLLVVIMSGMLIGNLPAQDKKKMHRIEIPPIVCHGSDEVSNHRIPPPDQFLKRLKSTHSQPTANIEVTYINFSEDAKKAFQYGVDIWSYLIKSPVTIKILASWEPMENGVLGSCGPTSFYTFAQSPDENVYYPIAVVEKMLGREVNGENEPEMEANFNSDKTNWYYGTDGNPPSGKHDLVTTVVHEIAHGLGYTGSMYVEDLGRTSIGHYGFGEFDYPAAFDIHVEDNYGDNLTDPTTWYVNHSLSLFSAYTRTLYYNGLSTVHNHPGNERALLYTPSEWNEGSSIYHLDDDLYDGTPNSLMTHAISLGESVHSPGPVSMGMLFDIGWMYTYIEHDSLKDVETLDDPLLVTAVIESDTTLKSDPYLYYSINDFTSFDSLKMNPTGNTNEYSRAIPLSQKDRTVYYYIGVVDIYNRQFTEPARAPENFRQFFVGTDVKPPEIDHQPIDFILSTWDSVEVSAQVSDNIGVDTVYVEYIIKGVEQVPFPLHNDTLDKYTGYFVLSGLDLNPGDEFEYRVIASDVAMQPNTVIVPESDYYQVDIEEIPPYVSEYTNDFNDPESAAEDFLFSGFSITTPEGFSSPSLNSEHPYTSPERDNGEYNFTAQLKIPVKIKDGNLSSMTFHEIALIEPGEESVNWPSTNFYDYVVVEGSKDGGRSWSALADGYDATRHSSWFALYNDSITAEDNSRSVGVPSQLKLHNIDLKGKDAFDAGDEILIRFRLYSDPYANGWGWLIDNLRIQAGDIVGTESHELDEKKIRVYPNPSEGLFTVKLNNYQVNEDVSLQVVDISGKIVHGEQFTRADMRLGLKKLNLMHLEKGYYFIVVSSPGKKLTGKIVIQ